MLFSIGTRVKFINTSDTGIVTELLDNGMVNVLLDKEDMEIPAFLDDLVRAEDQVDDFSSIKAKIVPGKKAKRMDAPDLPKPDIQYAILKSKGIQLAFDPILKKDANAERYKIFLINDTKDQALFTLTLKLKKQVDQRFNGKIAAMSVYEVGELLFDQLNDSPIFEVECWRVTTAGTEARLHKSLKIKPKQFFKKMTMAPLLNKQVHLFSVFNRLSGLGKKANEDLQTYTKRKARPSAQWNNIQERFSIDVMEFAEFDPELDLHIEKLVSDHQKLSNREILSIQLFHFEQYVSKAIRIGVDRVFVIHGLGKGKLRNEIATRLLQMDHIKTFKNEYHPRYGYGATEIVFG
jgi:hypothetical protein